MVNITIAIPQSFSDNTKNQYCMSNGCFTFTEVMEGFDLTSDPNLSSSITTTTGEISISAKDVCDECQLVDAFGFHYDHDFEETATSESTFYFLLPYMTTTGDFVFPKVSSIDGNHPAYLVFVLGDINTGKTYKVIIIHDGSGIVRKLDHQDIEISFVTESGLVFNYTFQAQALIPIIRLIIASAIATSAMQVIKKYFDLKNTEEVHSMLNDANRTYNNCVTKCYETYADPNELGECIRTCNNIHTPQLASAQSVDNNGEGGIIDWLKKYAKYLIGGIFAIIGMYMLVQMLMEFIRSRRG